MPRLFLSVALLSLLLASGSCPTWAGAARTQSLAGEWQIRLDEQNEGLTADWAGKGLPVSAGAIKSSIQLPGSTDQAGIGKPNPVAPSLAGLYRPLVYTGAAWFERSIEIPAAWAGKQVRLTLERNHWVTQVWLDGRDLGTRDSLVTPHEYDLGQVQPGNHRLTIRTDNTLKYDLGRFVHINYDGTQTNWCGIIGRIELDARDLVAVEYVQIYPSAAEHKIKVRARIINASEAAASGEMTLLVKDRNLNKQLALKTLKVECPGASAEIEGEVSLGDTARLWDEFSPVLHDLHVTLKTTGKSRWSDEKVFPFGLRDFGTKGTQFTLNGRPVFFRGNVENAIFPLTGFPATDVAGWKRIFGVHKAYGLNHVRYHSWCPPEAAFVAADELGIFLQVEGPIANVPTGPIPARDAFIAEELRRILRVYGNHPSFVLLTPGNEMRGRKEPLAAMVDECVAADPRHLYSMSTYGFGILTDNRQFTVLSKARGVKSEGTENDFRNIVADDARPIIAHEVGQHSIFPNFAEMKKYTGIVRPANFEIVRDALAAKGMLPLAPKFFEATGRQSLLLYKEEIEQDLRTPGLAGFQLLDLQDYPGQGTALVGILDPLWESKGLIAEEKFREFCDVTVPLLRMKKRTYFANEPFNASVEVSHFGATALPQTAVRWKITDERSREIAGGLLPAKKIETGGLTPFGTFGAKFEKANSPAKLTVTLELEGANGRNSWEIWVYPNVEPVTAPSGVLVAKQWDAETAAALARGEKVILFPQGTFAGWKKGSFKPVFWSPVWFKSDPGTMSILCDPKHPALAKFPTEFYANWQWWDLMNRSGTFVLNEAPANFEPIVRVIDNFSRNDRLGNVWEAKVGQGRLLVCSINLTDDLERRPAATQLLRSLYSYVGSSEFTPKQSLPPEVLNKIFAPAILGVMQKLGAKVVRVDSENEQRRGDNLVDGNPDTVWQTPWNDGAPKYPHQFTVEFPTLLVAKGCRVLPRQDGNIEGGIKDYAIYVSRDGLDWGEPVLKGTLDPGQEVKTLLFPTPLEVKLVRFVALSGVDKEAPSAALAEFEIIPE
ncbi:MAG: discoidin domain-containing protein [Nibricoccus sp.]